MLTITLAALMALANPVIDGTGTDKDQEGNRTQSRVETAPPAHLPATYNQPYMPTERGKMWVSFGYGSVTNEFDDDGSREPLGTLGLPANADDLNASFSSLVLNLGGSYTFYRIGDMNLNGGINFAMAQQREEADALTVGGTSIPALDRSSGFAPQNLTIFGEIERPVYSLRVGYLQDLGSDPESADERHNTDMQSAIQFGASTQTWTGPMRIFGGIDYFLTLPGDELEGSDTRLDVGDIANLNAGAGYNWGNGEVGVALLYRLNREGSPAPATPNREFGSGYVLSAVPYVTYAPVGRNYQLSVKGALQREYHDYGFALAGRNDIAPQAGVTVGLTYGL